MNGDRERSLDWDQRLATERPGASYMRFSARAAGVVAGDETLTHAQRAHHQRDRTATRGVQAQNQNADCTAVRGHGRNVVLGVTCFRPDQHAQSRLLENHHHKTHRSAIGSRRLI
jgi:hypothetical protein